MLKDNNMSKFDNRRELIADLRSGKFKQGRGQLKTSNEEFCCLGVSCNTYQRLTGIGSWVKAPHYRQRGGEAFFFHSGERMERNYLPQEVKEFFGFTSQSVELVKPIKNEGYPLACDLATLNDTLRYTFEQIADIIENSGVLVKD